MPANEVMDTRTTADRILDVAEDLFAEKGYQATSLGDVADRVGIRPPSLYNHFRNKAALYQAVLERLLKHFRVPLERSASAPMVEREDALAWAREMVELHFAYPNFARLLQHAALAEAPGTEEILARFFQPLFAPRSGRLYPAEAIQPWAVMAFNNIIVSYITMAPLYRNLIGIDPFSPKAKAMQMEAVLELVDAMTERYARNARECAPPAPTKKRPARRH